MPKIRAHSPESAWVPSLDACRTVTTDKTHQVERRKAEARAKARVKAMPIGQPEVNEVDIRLAQRGQGFGMCQGV